MTTSDEHLPSRIQVQRVERTFAGPLPPPEVLARYNEVIPHAAERILAMAESQQGHRQKLEVQVVTSNFAAQRLGMLLGFAIAMTAIGIGAYLIAHGQSASGLVSILATLVALVGAFLYGRKDQSAESLPRRKQP